MVEIPRMIEIRQIITQVEDVFHEFGPPPERPQRRGVAAAVIANPYAGRYEPDLLPMMAALDPLGLALARRLLAALGVGATAVEGYGKGAIVGTAGEIEHGALWHVPGGYGMRAVLGWQDSAGGSGGSGDAGARFPPGNARAIVPSTKKVGAPGARLDVPITHVNASYVRSHFDAIEFGVPGAPRADEIVVILAMTTGARVHARVGGLRAADIVGVDGLR